ncbi:hypothetical protein [Desulfovibrio gilichinskyi]|uniref:DUF5625 domain-containing protein n=1 Tax=Desulfovibrio gilichinskyi TaxID=1519643 RepID=A0A1X7E3A9_9BACT|nr:hypothetical protein [Desulfovibrio gilichinskyi]SMF26204.1 hypothetical protein SAMN06295933_2544 [Desulfovibrio gilichinskyi]
MKYILLGLGALIVGAYMIYSSNVFQSYIFPQQFYADISSGKLDPTIKNESITIPIHYKYNTRYALYLSIPTMFNQDVFKRTNGVIKYKFISKGNILEEGVTIPPSKADYLSWKDETFAAILKFDLPFPKAENDLLLELKVLTPLVALDKYSGSIRYSICPWEQYK